MAQTPSINPQPFINPQVSLQDIRSQFDAQFSKLTPAGKPTEIPTRSGVCKALVYGPHESSDLAKAETPACTNGSTPVLFNLHGGGFIIGAPIQNDLICQHISQTLGITVISPDYRLAPEFPFPAALDDTYDVVSYVKNHAEEFKIDPDRMAICGHSAGGNIAAACCLLAAREKTIRFRCCILDYAHLNVENATSSGNSNVLSSEIVNYFNDAYRGNHDAKDPLVCPLCATDDELVDFPSCLNITPEHGPYRDDNENFAKRLIAAGVEVLSKRFLGVDHGFTEMYFHQPNVTDAVSIDAAEQAVDLMEWELRRHFGLVTNGSLQ